MREHIQLRLPTNSRFPPEIQAQRIREVMDNELTGVQYDAITAFFFEGKTIRSIAQEWGVQPSSVSRAIQRGLVRMERCLKY